MRSYVKPGYLTPYPAVAEKKKKDKPEAKSNKKPPKKKSA